MVAGATAAESKPAPGKKSAPAPASKPAAAAAAPAAGADKKDAPAKALKDPVAVVNGQEVTVADLEKVITAVLSQQGGSLNDVPADKKPQLYRQLLDGVIVEKLVTIQSSKMEVTDAEVSAEFDRFKGRFPDEKTMNEQLTASGQSAESIKGDIRKYLQQNHWLDTQLAGKTEVTEGEAETYFKANPEQFKAPEQVRASHILLHVDENAKEDEVKAKRTAADKILTRAKKGEDFDALVKQYTDDQAPGIYRMANNGVTPLTNAEDPNQSERPRNGMVPAFGNVGFAISPGNIEIAEYDLQDSPFGWHIIKRLK